MKKAALTFLTTLVVISSFSQKTNFLSILKDISNIMQDRQLTYQSLMKETILVNSRTNTSGLNRKIIKLNIPRNTARWYYRITVLDINSPFDYPANETLVYQLINKKEIGNLINNDIPIHVYFMNSSGEANNFMTYKSFKPLLQNSVENTNSHYALSSLVDENLYLGIQNTSLLRGAKIILEIVALTPKVSSTPLSTFQSINQLKDAKDLYDLGVINKKSYDSIVQLYSPKLTRQEAIEKLKEAKKKLDAGEISQAEYDNIKNTLTPIILSQQ